MERQHRGRKIIGRVLNWYYGSLRFIEERRLENLARKNARHSDRNESTVCPDSRNPTKQCHYLCQAVGHCVSASGRSKRYTR